MYLRLTLIKTLSDSPDSEGRHEMGQQRRGRHHETCREQTTGQVRAQNQRANRKEEAEEEARVYATLVEPD